MTDLVERLRRQAPYLDGAWAEKPNGELMNEGADALEAAIEEAASWRRIAERLEGEKQDALEAAQAQAAEVRRETIGECAQHLTTLADAMHEKAEAIADRSSRHGPFVRPLTSERDAAVMAYDFEQAAIAIGSLTEAAKEPDHVPDAGNMIAKAVGHHIPDAGEMVGKDNADG